MSKKKSLPSSLHRLWISDAQGNNLDYLPGPSKVLGCGRSNRKCCPWASDSGRCSPLAGAGRLTSLLWVCVAGIMYRKSCASSAACLIASAGYQSFCSPGKLNSVCISCCNTPLCNGPRPKKRSSSASALRPWLPSTILLLKIALFSAHC
nr:ly6/PLAUR domain-containing protein 1 [Odocoileus virginianus texanus]